MTRPLSAPRLAVSWLFIMSLLSTMCAGEPQPTEETARNETRSTSPSEQRLSEIFPDFRTAREVEKPFYYLSIHCEEGSLLGCAAGSDKAGTTAEGYGGPVPVLVYLDSELNILDFDLLENDETPAYLAIALSNDFTDRIKRYSPFQEEPIDAVSLATISSQAIIDGITGVVDRLAEEILDNRTHNDRQD